jgi:hypothetical protein
VIRTRSSIRNPLFRREGYEGGSCMSRRFYYRIAVLG